jgi:ubiquinone/menaquinone biosynthesis C-methylase UbiE
MYQHLSSVFRFLKNANAGSRILSISQSQYLCSLLNVKNAEISETNFPQCDILKLPFPDNYFDYVVSDQVLEHVEGNPQQAVDETYRILKHGGVAVHTTCFFYGIHDSPKDFWRFSPEALAFLCKRFSKVIDVGGWGNFYVWLMFWLGLERLPIPHAKWHPLHKMAIKNQENYPIVTWVVTKK